MIVADGRTVSEFDHLLSLKDSEMPEYIDTEVRDLRDSDSEEEITLLPVSLAIVRGLRSVSNSMTRRLKIRLDMRHCE